MSHIHWSEAANRRLRALLWKGWSVPEMALSLGRPAADVATQIARLGIRLPVRLAQREPKVV